MTATSTNVTIATSCWGIRSHLSKAAAAASLRKPLMQVVDLQPIKLTDAELRSDALPIGGAKYSILVAR